MAGHARLTILAVITWMQFSTCYCQGGMHLLENTGIDGFPTTCKLTKNGGEYAGQLHRTTGGYSCQRWDSNRPHHNYHVDSTHFPGGSSSVAGNNCRNPDRGWDGGPWCYTTSRRKRWQRCTVSFCECKTTTQGREYMGEIAVTVNNRTCQSWSSSIPHSHAFTDAAFPDKTLTSASNFCRNPNSTHPDGPWCLTTDPSVEWEYCNIPPCNLTLEYFTTSAAPTTAGTTVPTTSTTVPTTSTTVPTTSTTVPTTSTTVPTTSTIVPTTSTTVPTTIMQTTTMSSTTSSEASTRSTTTTATLPTTTTSTQRPTSARSFASTRRPSSTSTLPSADAAAVPTKTISATTRSTEPAEQSPSSSHSSSNRMVKIVVPVVIGVVAVVAIAIACVYLWKRHEKKSSLYEEAGEDNYKKDAIGDGYDNPSYNTGKQEVRLPPVIYPGVQS